jgi:Dyp-type peroxidase family
MNELGALRPDVLTVTLLRGYQREDGTEPFGYQDGVRNARRSRRRPGVVFVHRDGNELDEPAWSDGGSYMADLKILQRPDQFAALPDDAARDATIGRTKDGTRLDRVGQQGDPRDEPPDVPTGLPPTSHVRKAGPRGEHDATQVVRRGLPFIETTADGELRIGLNFCSFQASLAASRSEASVRLYAHDKVRSDCAGATPDVSGRRHAKPGRRGFGAAVTVP